MLFLSPASQGKVHLSLTRLFVSPLALTLRSRPSFSLSQISTLSSIYYKPPEAFVMKQAPISRGDDADDDLDEDAEVRGGVYSCSFSFSAGVSLNSDLSLA